MNIQGIHPNQSFNTSTNNSQYYYWSYCDTVPNQASTPCASASYMYVINTTNSKQQCYTVSPANSIISYYDGCMNTHLQQHFTISHNTPPFTPHHTTPHHTTPHHTTPHHTTPHHTTPHHTTPHHTTPHHTTHPCQTTQLTHK
jgi:hypothetical protein